MIIYQDVRHPEKYWARPAQMWEETIQVGGRSVPRFQFVEEEAEEPRRGRRKMWEIRRLNAI